jgi:hypothetical protein
MFREIQELFRSSWQAFRTEAARREPEDEVAELLTLMRREMVAARAALPEYERAEHEAQADLERERTALLDCRRRKELSDRIGDSETARIAEEFAIRHAQRVAVLEQKHAAARAETRLRRQESEEMTRRYKEADLHRFGLVAELRRARAQGSFAGEGGEPRPAGREAASGDPLADRGLDELSDLERLRKRESREAEVDERLAEIKRRLGRD